MCVAVIRSPSGAFWDDINGYLDHNRRDLAKITSFLFYIYEPSFTIEFNVNRDLPLFHDIY